MRTIILLLLVSTSVEGQFFERGQVPTYACMFTAGAAYGYAERLIWHNPHPGSSFYDPYESWEHKHGLINADAYHISRAVEHGSFIVGAALSFGDLKGKKNKALIVLKRATINTACFAIGMATTYR